MSNKLRTNFTHADVKITQETTLFQGFYQMKKYQLQHRLYEGGWSQPISRECVNRRPVAAVLPYDPTRDEVVLIEQFRIGSLQQNNPWLIEIVAGIVDPDENAEQMARRETKEETGLEVLELLPIYEYWVSPGGSNEHLSLFLAIVDASHAGGTHGLAAEEEDIRVFPVSTAVAFQALKDGQINNAATVVALQWLQLQKLLGER